MQQKNRPLRDECLSKERFPYLAARPGKIFWEGIWLCETAHVAKKADAPPAKEDVSCRPARQETPGRHLAARHGIFREACECRCSAKQRREEGQCPPPQGKTYRAARHGTIFQEGVWRVAAGAWQRETARVAKNAPARDDVSLPPGKAAGSPPALVGKICGARARGRRQRPPLPYRHASRICGRGLGVRTATRRDHAPAAMHRGSCAWNWVLTRMISCWLSGERLQSGSCEKRSRSCSTFMPCLWHSAQICGAAHKASDSERLVSALTLSEARLERGGAACARWRLLSPSSTSKA